MGSLMAPRAMRLALRPRPRQAPRLTCSCSENRHTPLQSPTVQLRNRDRDATPFVTKDGSTIRELHHTPAQSLAEASLEPGAATRRHYHARSEEIYLVVEGSGDLEVAGETRAVASGDAVLIPVGIWHELKAHADGVRLLCCCVPPYSDEDTFFA